MKSLVVDDDLTNRKLLYAMLENVSKCDIAVNGKEAIEYFQLSRKENDVYDVIFLDIKMPIMNGYEALKQIRKIEKGNRVSEKSQVKVVMVTAMGDKASILNAFYEGCEYYLVKPFQQQKLFDILEELGYGASVENVQQ